MCNLQFQFLQPCLKRGQQNWKLVGSFASTPNWKEYERLTTSWTIWAISMFWSSETEKPLNQTGPTFAARLLRKVYARI